MEEAKLCPICQELKSLEAFSRDKTARDGRSRRCRACRAAYYKATRAHSLATTKAWKAAHPGQTAGHAAGLSARRAENSALLTQLKLTLSCVDCGWTPATAEECPRLEFDHIDPSTKHRTHTSSAFHGGWPWPRIQAEIALCEPRCRECHRDRTTRERHRLIRRNPEMTR